MYRLGLFRLILPFIFLEGIKSNLGNTPYVLEFKALTLSQSMLCRSYLCLEVLVELRGHSMGGCCLLQYCLLGQIHILNMEIFGCVHGKAWNPGLAVLVCFLIWTCTHTIYVSPHFTNFIFFCRFDLALLPCLLWVPGCTLHIHNVGYASDSEWWGSKISWPDF